MRRIPHSSIWAALAFVAFVACTLGWTAPLAHAAVTADLPEWPHPSEMEFDSIVFNPPEPERFELQNGIVVYFLENRELPILESAIYLPVGSLVESADQFGLASLTAELIRTGGAGELTPEEVDEELEFMAAGVSVSSGMVFTSVSFQSLSEYAERTLEIVTDMLTRPAFSPERLEIARGRIIESIRRQNDDPTTVAFLEFYRRLAPDHPLGWTMNEETVRSFDIEDLVAFHERHYRPGGAVIVVAGDIDLESLQDMLERTVGTWPRSESVGVEPPPFDPAPEPKLYHAQKETAQSTIFMGYPTLMYADPDYPKLVIANHVLGGGAFDNRLFAEIRGKRGLAYHTQSSLTQGHLYPGVFYAMAFTRADATAEVVQLMKDELTRLVAEPIPSEELERHREAILNRAVFEFATPRAIIQAKALAEIYNLPSDYYERYIAGIQTATSEEIQAAAKRWIDPDRMITLIVGDGAAFDQPLDVFGEVELIEL